MSCNDCRYIGELSNCCEQYSIGGLLPETPYTILVVDVSTNRKFYFNVVTNVSGNFEFTPNQSFYAPNRTYEIRAYQAACGFDTPATFDVCGEASTCLSFEVIRIEQLTDVESAFVYLTDENGDILTDECNNEFIDNSV